MFLSMLSPIGVKLFSFSPKFSLSLFLFGSAILEIYINKTNVLLLWQTIRILVEDVRLYSSLFGCSLAVSSTDDIRLRSTMLLRRIQWLQVELGLSYDSPPRLFLFQTLCLKRFVDLLLKFLKLICVANFYKYAIMSKFVELKRRLFVGLTK